MILVGKRGFRALRGNGFARAPETQRPNSRGRETLCHPTAARPKRMLCHSRTSKHKPAQHVQRIVVARIASESIVVVACSVELGVSRVLHRQSNIAAWQPI